MSIFKARDFDGQPRGLKVHVATVGGEEQLTPAMAAELRVAGADVGTANPVPVDAAGAAITGAALPAGGTGLTGWLSAIWARLAGVVLAAGEAHVGRVGGEIVAAVPDALPATSTTAYAAGDVLGGKMKFTNALRVAAGSGLLQDVTLTLASTQTAGIDLVLFRADPAASTFTDNLAFAVAAADLAKVIGTVSLTRATALGAGTAYEINQLARSLKLDAGRDLWAVPVWRGAATLATVADLAAVRANILVD